jgi:Photosynthetic reaction centre cytochrome C subunit
LKIIEWPKKQKHIHFKICTFSFLKSAKLFLMKFISSKKACVIIILTFSIFIIQASTQQAPVQDDKPQNLKILPKNISSEELHDLMKVYAKSLGVRCNHCHAQKKDDAKKLDFASDEKPEKAIARKMMNMTTAINKKYISKIADHNLEHIACVTCHMGHIKPVISVDSLMKN